MYMEEPFGTPDMIVSSNVRDIPEVDPNGLRPEQAGSKLDNGKSPLRRGVMDYFPRALEAISMVSLHGSKKYAWNGWKSVSDGIGRYGDAQCRHAAKAAKAGDCASLDPDSGLLHAAHEAWNVLARLELILMEIER